MSIWHNVRVDVVGTDHAALIEACEAGGVGDVVVRQGRHGLVAEGEVRNVTKPQETSVKIAEKVRERFPGVEARVRIYKPVEKPLAEIGVMQDGKLEPARP
ncbi:hypothetical protein WME89_16290 [Sorangium sp. So ce321]|uniref:hypothetical protein n=1 Tax=Sorangium sp. So ce321 TaxID=3133300 RepID=UPI003F631A9C